MRAGRHTLLFCALLAAAAAIARARTTHHADALGDSDPAVRVAAARWLAERGADSAWAVPRLTSLLDDASTAAMAAFALGEIGGAAASAVPALAAHAQHADPLLRIRVAVALLRIAPSHPLAVAAIARVRASPEPWVRKLAEIRLRSS